MNSQDFSLIEAASAIRKGSLSPLEYVSTLLEWTEKLEPRIQAWATLDRAGALREAAACEAEARKQQFRGPLHGIPVGIKDIFFTTGLPTTMGTTIFHDFVPSYDAAAVTKLRQAGAIVMGKTITTPFAFVDPGPTRNPWNPAHTPGGSSSGSAAAVAARMCPIALGTQTVGSVSRPGSFNGIVSIMPTQERISRHGTFPLAWSLDHVGAFSRSAADIELLMYAMCGIPMEKSDHVRSRRKFRIGVIREFFYEKASSEMQSLTDNLARTLAGSGFGVEETALPPTFNLAQPAVRTILRAEASSVHASLFPANTGAYRDKLRELIETGLLLDATDYLRARRQRRRYQRDMARLFEHYDALMTPAAPGPAPEGIGSTGDAVMNAPWTLADFPTMTLPHALSSQGMPIGVQLCTDRLQEGLLLEIAKAIEAVVGFHPGPKLETNT